MSQSGAHNRGAKNALHISRVVFIILKAKRKKQTNKNRISYKKKNLVERQNYFSVKCQIIGKCFYS